MGWRKVHKEELYGMFSSINSTRMIQSRILRWARNVTRMGERRDGYRVLVGKTRERDRLGYQDSKGMIIIKCNFKKWDEAWTGLIWLRIGTDGGCCKCGSKENLVYTKC